MPSRRSQSDEPSIRHTSEKRPNLDFVWVWRAGESDCEHRDEGHRTTARKVPPRRGLGTHAERDRQQTDNSVQSREQFAGVAQRQELRIAPLPKPEELAHFDAVLPGLAERIVSMAEANGLDCHLLLRPLPRLQPQLPGTSQEALAGSEAGIAFPVTARQPPEPSRRPGSRPRERGVPAPRPPACRRGRRPCPPSAPRGRHLPR